MRVLLSAFFLLQLGICSWAQEMSYLFVEKDVMSVSQASLQDVATLSAMHDRYKADWVARYISTEITVVENGTSLSAKGVDGKLNDTQKSLLKKAGVGAQVIVSVKYMPNNTLKHNTEQEMDYKYAVTPAVLAEFPGGETMRNAYVDNNILAKLDAQQKALLKIAKMNFAVAADGSIVDINMFESSGNEALDAILVQGMREMPKWKPAQKSDGTPVAQPMKFYISNSKGNCLMY